MSYTAPRPVQRHTHSLHSLIDSTLASMGSVTLGQLATAGSQAVYTPLIVRHPVVVKQLFFGNSTTATGNYDIGLYTADGTALVRSGSNAKPSNSSEILFDCADTPILPGVYYVGLVFDVLTDTMNRVSIPAPMGAALGLFAETSAFPLPATATFSDGSALTSWPIVGMLVA